MGADTSVIKDETRMKFNGGGRKSEWKNTEGKGKAMDTNTGESPGHQSQFQ